MTEASFKELMNRRKESGLTVRDFCSNEGIADSLYYYWLKKHKQKATQPKEFIPLLVNHPFPTQKSHQLSRPISDTHTSDAHQPDDVLLEFVFPNGTRLRVRNPVDLSIMQAIVHLYD
jgi:hypothetical protein